MNDKIFYSEYFYQKGSKNTDVLEKNAKEHPYSSLAAFLLLYHYKKTSHPDFEKLATKTALLFNNTHWLQFQLNDTSFSNSEQEIISNESSPEEKEVAVEIESEVPEEISSIQNAETIAETNEIIAETIPQILHEENKQQDNIIDHNFEEIVTGESTQQNNFIENENTIKEDEIIAFEPLHTVDYFASQGIKINEELLKNDKLGSQMKSFTAWLKSMKKLHPGKLEEQSLATEKLIQTSADESNINTEILTEAMAEVLIKQDKREKAIEMFSKLSLINPSKSAYFAARIESIKSN